MLSVLVAFGAVTGASEGIKASQTKARREEHRSRKNNLIVHVPKSSEFSQTLEGRRVVLSGNKLYVDTGLDNEVPFGHPFEGYFLGYPELGHPGLVSTITDEAPIMNWIYMDVETFELKFGTRQFSEGNMTGPFDCTRQDRRLTLHGYENFVAVQQGPFWALYFDWDGDHLEGKVPAGTPVVEIDLVRRELRNRKPRRQPGEQNPAAQDSTQAAKDPATDGTRTDGKATSATATNAKATNGAGTNGKATNGTGTNGTPTNGTPTNGTPTNGRATNAPGTTATATDGRASNATATNSTATSSTGTNGRSTNAMATNGRSTNATGTNGRATNITGTNGRASNVTATNGNAQRNAAPRTSTPRPPAYANTTPRR